jgi:hypothetical protein
MIVKYGNSFLTYCCSLLLGSRSGFVCVLLAVCIITWLFHSFYKYPELISYIIHILAMIKATAGRAGWVGGQEPAPFPPWKHSGPSTTLMLWWSCSPARSSQRCWMTSVSFINTVSCYQFYTIWKTYHRCTQSRLKQWVLKSQSLRNTQAPVLAGHWLILRNEILLIFLKCMRRDILT